MLGGVLFDLRCLSVVVMLVCCSGTTVLILGTDGLSCVQRVSDQVVIAPLTAMVSSWRMPSTLAKAVAART
jgi:hypothetical protein